MAPQRIRIAASGSFGILLLLWIVRLLMKLPDFNTALRQLNIEIRRSAGAEQKHFRHARRHLWHRFLNPFSLI